MRRTVLCLVLLALAAAPAGAAPPRMEGPFLQGADLYWVWRAPHPKALVVFMHGLDQSELYPGNHLPWIDHLVRAGNDVVYPRYENAPGRGPALLHSAKAVAAGIARLGRPHVPVVIVGYSRGGRLAVELAASTGRTGVVPAAVMSIFPSRLNPQVEEVVDLARLPHSARVVLLAGQEDSPAGVHDLLIRLRDGGFPAGHVEADVIRSKGSFHADHFSALQTTPEARRQFWSRLDRLIASVTR
jgi:pimeloyl-ACP methyl ester carboxylesterase